MVPELQALRDRIANIHDDPRCDDDPERGRFDLLCDIVGHLMVVIDDRISDSYDDSEEGAEPEKPVDILADYPCLACAADPTDPQRNTCPARKMGHCPEA